MFLLQTHSLLKLPCTSYTWVLYEVSIILIIETEIEISRINKDYPTRNPGIPWRSLPRRVDISSYLVTIVSLLVFQEQAFRTHILWIDNLTYNHTISISHPFRYTLNSVECTEDYWLPFFFMFYFGNLTLTLFSGERVYQHSCPSACFFQQPYLLFWKIGWNQDKYYKALLLGTSQDQHFRNFTAYIIFCCLLFKPSILLQSLAELLRKLKANQV